MKLLFFTSKPIYPPVDGGCFASEKFLSNLLYAGIDIQYATLSTNKHPFDLSKFPEELVTKVNPVNFFVDTDVKVFSALKSLFTSSSYNTDRFYTPDVRQKLLRLLNDHSFDGIILDSLYTLPYLADIRSRFDGKIAVRTHNVEYRLWEQYAADASGLKKWYLKRLSADLKQFERDNLNEVNTIFSISKDDTNVFAENGVHTPIVDIPVTIETTTSDFTIHANRIYHLGMMDWEPNRQAVNQLIEWMPELRVAVPQLELHVVGSKSEQYVQEDESKGIFVHGYVDSVDDFSRTHGILVSPIKAASGVRIKFLEAMAMGVPIITTTVGALGIEHTSCNCLCIADSKIDFIRNIQELTSSPEKRKEIGQNALNYINKNHNIDTVSQRIVETFQANS